MPGPDCGLCRRHLLEAWDSSSVKWEYWVTSILSMNHLSALIQLCFIFGLGFLLSLKKSGEWEKSSILYWWVQSTQHTITRCSPEAQIQSSHCPSDATFSVKPQIGAAIKTFVHPSPEPLYSAIPIFQGTMHFLLPCLCSSHFPNLNILSCPSPPNAHSSFSAQSNNNRFISEVSPGP